MIPIPLPAFAGTGSVRVWIATGYTDMRKGMQGLALLVQQLKRDPHAGDLYVFRGRAGSLIIAWDDTAVPVLARGKTDTGRLWTYVRDDRPFAGPAPPARLFCGSDRGGQRAAVTYSLIVTANLNDVDPQAWLADILARIAGHPANRLDELLPWHWRNDDSVLSHAA